MNGILKSIAVVAIVSFFLSACGGESSGESSGTMTPGGGLDGALLSDAGKRGLAIFQDPAYACTSCHGSQGQGTPSAGGPLDEVSPAACATCGDLATLTNINELTMPATPYLPSSCVGACASDVSQFIIEGLIQGLALPGATPPATPNLNLTGTNNFSTTEGANSSFMISLATQPTDIVTVDFAVSDANEATMAQTSYSILPADWQTPITVTVMGVDDNVLDPQAATAYSIAVTTSSNDANYNGLTIPAISATNNDNELVGQGQFVFDKTMGLVTTEDGGTDTFTITLNTMPNQDVTVSLSSSNALEGTVNPATHTFNAGNFSTPQLFTVTGVNDTPPNVDGPIAYNIAVTATSTDRAYMGVDPSDVMATNQDNDVQVSIANFSSNAVGNLPFGSDVVLTWTSDGEFCTAGGATANGQWTGNLNASDSVTLTNLTTAGVNTFSITCSNAANAVPATASVNVTVDAQLGAPTVNLTANPTTVNYNGSSTLSWTTTDAASCSATSVPPNAAWDNANKAVNNAAGELIGPLTATTTFSLTCTNASMLNTTAQATVTVNPAMPSLTFSANNTTINSGDSVTLNWNAVDLASCTASAIPANAEWTGAKGVLPTNSQTINNLTATTTFTLACTGINAAVLAPQNVMVTVNAGDPILIQGKIEYERVINGQSCETCHGTNGLGILGNGLYDGIVDYVNGNVEGTVIFYTEFLMPKMEAGEGGMPSDCVDTPGDGNPLNDCATNVTKYMKNGFSVIPPAQ